MFLIAVTFYFLVIRSEISWSMPASLLDVKYPLTREEAFKKLNDKSDFIFDFYNARDIDIIKGATAGRTVRAKVS